MKKDTTDLYYSNPSDKIFNEVKQISMVLWGTYDDTYGYATGKIDSIKNLPNTNGYFMEIISMFDFRNQTKLAKTLSKESNFAIRERLIYGGASEIYIAF